MESDLRGDAVELAQNEREREIDSFFFQPFFSLHEQSTRDWLKNIHFKIPSYSLIDSECKFLVFFLLSRAVENLSAFT